MNLPNDPEAIKKYTIRDNVIKWRNEENRVCVLLLTDTQVPIVMGLLEEANYEREN